MLNTISLLNKICYGFAAFLLFAAATNYIPGFTDKNGLVFGIFNLDIYKDMLHVLSAIWAFLSARGTRETALKFLQVFGTIYLIDGIAGLFTGASFLDLSLFMGGIQPVNSWFIRFASNVPHLSLGLASVYSGFVLSKKT